MTAHLPPNLLRLFAARPPIPYLPPPDENRKPLPQYSGIAAYISRFTDADVVEPPPATQPETKQQRKERKRQEKMEKNNAQIAEEITKWDPHENPEATGDAWKTLFVARLNYKTSKRKLEREFEEYGPIKRVRLVTDQEGKSRGYAFIEFESEHDMKTAYKEADGRKLDDYRILVDVERGRTVKGWRPRRLGGGLGGRRPTEPGRSGSAPTTSAREQHSALGRQGSRESDRHRSSSSSRRSSYADDRGSRGSRPRDRDYDRGSSRNYDRDRDRDRHRDRNRDRSRDRHSRR
ncbi:U1 small nuclear ribonucleoprotein 70 kDa [Balamuthia mandrillaris]